LLSFWPSTESRLPSWKCFNSVIFPPHFRASFRQKRRDPQKMLPARPRGRSMRGATRTTWAPTVQTPCRQPGLPSR
jgi:hypothetical protein